MSAPIGPVESHRDQALPRRQVDTLGIIRKMRSARAPRRIDQRRFAPLSGNPHQVEARFRILRIFIALAARCTQGDDPFAVGRPDRVAVKRRNASELLGLASPVGGTPPKVPSLWCPAHIRQRLTIRRPARVKFAHITRGEQPGLAVGQIQRVQLRQGRECQMLAVRRELRLLNQPRLHRAVVDPDRKIQPRSDRQRHPH